MDKLIEYLRYAVDHGASDLFFIAGAPVSMKTDGRITHLSEE